MSKLRELIINNLKGEYCVGLNKDIPAHELHNAVGRAVIAEISDQWAADTAKRNSGRQACYLSCEFLMGRAVFNNLYCAGLLDDVKGILSEQGIDINKFEEIEDAALGNGGLGRLAACFLDSAATLGVPLTGYGIRYRYGLFKQYIHEGCQGEEADDWLRFGDPWSVRRESEAVTVEFGDGAVRAVPYDMPIIGYGLKSIGTLRLWQAESLQNFNFAEFDKQEYLKASEEKINAEAISDVLYPNDNYEKGLRLRVKQQYFFVSATIQTIIKEYKSRYGSDFSHFAEQYAVQLNDTHPVVAIPEIVRILMFKEGLTFGESFEIARKVCSYTNHTVMAEALEKWDAKLYKSVLPIIYEIIMLINEHLIKHLKSLGQTPAQIAEKSIFDGSRIHMARLAIYGGEYINGVAAIHSEILRKDALKEWYEIYPEKFQNKTNGITPRRWLGLCNPELSALITEKIGDGWQTDLDRLVGLKKYVDDPATISRFIEIKAEKKRQLAAFIKEYEGVEIDPTWVFDVQVKRLHEYKRQLLNAFSVMDLYFKIKEKKLPDLAPTVFIFGAKAAPAYRRAKAIIKYINCVAELVNNDPETKDKLKVIFLHNYNVSYAEKIIPAADISEQISTAGTEASGTGNMKFMANGAVTLGTWDGANVEITEKAGWENEYIFGCRVEEIARIRPTYRPKEKIYNTNDRVKRVVNTLVDGTFNDGDRGWFGELYSSLTIGASWHKPDVYFLLADLEGYVDTKLRALYDSKNKQVFAKKCWMNIANSGFFSSDRTIKQYASELWHI
ncbi:MAG: glycogen/starch/alpha-glucan phosphorylase [Ruminococcus sp.]|jgi:starch phosphorylase|nr:glycogen/starch/alpha-glucan phosphorylase [Ruminococcus sp.]